MHNKNTKLINAVYLSQIGEERGDPINPSLYFACFLDPLGSIMTDVLYCFDSDITLKKSELDYFLTF